MQRFFGGSFCKIQNINMSYARNLYLYVARHPLQTVSVAKYYVTIFVNAVYDRFLKIFSPLDPKIVSMVDNFYKEIHFRKLLWQY
jgi:hypothetical protein